MAQFKNSHIAIFAIIALLGIGWYTGALERFSVGSDGATLTEEEKETSDVVDTNDRSAAVTVTLETNSKYDTGSAVTTTNSNIIKLEGSNKRTEVSGDGTFVANQGAKYEIATGIGKDDGDEDSVAYGRKFNYVVPTAEGTTDVIAELVAPQVSSVSDVSTAYFNDNSVANTGTTTAAGGVYNLAIKFTGKFKKDYGSSYCAKEDSLGMGTLLVVKYNTTQVDAIDGVKINGVNGVDTSIPLAVQNDLAATGFALKAWKMGAIESNNQYKVDYVLDGDDTVAINTTASALTWALYDAGMYLDNKDNTVKCGVADERDDLLGVSSKVTVTPSVGA